MISALVAFMQQSSLLTGIAYLEAILGGDEVVEESLLESEELIVSEILLGTAIERG